MKRIFKLPALLLFASVALFFVGCEEDPIINPGDEKPVVTLTSSSDITIAPGELFSVNFSASKGGDSPLQAVTVYEDGTKVPFSRLTYNGTAAAANPALIVGDDVDGLTWTIDIVAHTTANTTVTYEIEVQDQASEKQSVFVNVTTVAVAPTLTTTSANTVVTGPDIKNVFRLTAEKGTGSLVSIEVRENDQFMDPSRVFWKEISMSVTENPFFLAEEDREGFEEQELFLMTATSPGEYVYTVILTDEFGLTSQVEYNVSTFRAIEMLEGVLLNSAGPMGTGGLDLDTGDGTASDDIEAEIKDNGIDLNLPMEDNWLRTISPINDATMKYLRAGENGLSETFEFENINFKEDLPGLYENGVELTDGASEVVQIADVFIVKRDERYWVLQVIQIVTDPNNNEDSYTFDIKY